MYKNELAFTNHDNAMKVAQMLLNENYVVMLSLEEQLIILNWEWSPYSYRGDVVFMTMEEFEEKYYEKVEDEEENVI